MVSNEEIKEIKAWCNSRKLKYTINDDGTVDIVGDVNIKRVKNGRFPIRFGKIIGNFSCACNNGYTLTTLEGGPSFVSGNFNCSGNNLTTLEGAPATVGGWFECNSNNLTTLEGAPATVGGCFECNSNNLTTLKGAPASVSGWFDCSQNHLTSLEGAPASVGGKFDCSINSLTNLEGGPLCVSGDYCCYFNKLASLKGTENTVIGGELSIDESVKDFEFVPKKAYRVGSNYHRIIITDKMDLKRGYYIIAPRVRTLGVLCRKFVTRQGAHKTMDLFHLPIRVDILGSVPPDIEKIEPSSISLLELHVPKGEVEVYSNHKQWKRAFLITDDNGAIFFSNPKNAARYEEHLVLKAKLEEKRKQLEIEEAKAEKLEQMQNLSHETLCRQLLAAYQPEITLIWNNTFEVNLTLKSGLKLTLKVKREENPLTVWQSLLKYVEKFDNIQCGDQPLGCEVNLKMDLS